MRDQRTWRESDNNGGREGTDPALAPERLTDEQWQAVLDNDSSYDGSFYYAVKTTGIFCRPSCRSKPPKRANIGSYLTAEQALAGQYRPCKRCKPTRQQLPDEEWIAIATGFIERNYAEKLTLEVLANSCHGTPFHLHRTFRKVTGMTPVEYIQRIRIEQAKAQLLSTNAKVTAIGESVGLPNTPYFITLFKRMTGLTPEGYRQSHHPSSEGKEDPNGSIE